MSKRKKMNNAVSKNVFIRAAVKTNSKNVMPHPQRGGYRM